MKHQKTSNRHPYKKVKLKNKRSDWDLTQEVMEQIKLGKVKKLTPEERDELDRKYQVGKYRPYQVDWERIKQLEKDTREEYSAIMKGAHAKRNPNNGAGYNKAGNGKKQQAAELERLKQELENG